MAHHLRGYLHKIAASANIDIVRSVSCFSVFLYAGGFLVAMDIFAGIFINKFKIYHLIIHRNTLNHL